MGYRILRIAACHAYLARYFAPVRAGCDVLGERLGARSGGVCGGGQAVRVVGVVRRLEDGIVLFFRDRLGGDHARVVGILGGHARAVGV